MQQLPGGNAYRKTSAQFENQASDECKGIVLCMKKLHFISWNCCKEESTVAPGPVLLNPLFWLTETFYQQNE